MPWFLVDDAFPNQEAVLAVSLAARGLWVTAGAWSSARQADVVPEHVLAALGSTPELVSELVTARLWKRARGGYRFNQEGTCKIPSKEAVDNARKNKAERQARWRAGKRDVDAPDRLHVDAGVDAVDNSKLKPGAQSGTSERRCRRNVDASTPPSTWYPGPDPGSNPVVDVVNRTNGSNGRASPAVIDAIMKEIHDTTGKLIDDTWAMRIAADLLQNPAITNPCAYVRKAIRAEADPAARFLPNDRPGYERKHARQEQP